MAAKGDAAGAEAVYSEILADDPGEAKAIGGLAKLHVAAGRLDEAKALLETAPAAAPGKEQDPAVVAAWAASPGRAGLERRRTRAARAGRRRQSE